MTRHYVLMLAAVLAAPLAGAEGQTGWPASPEPQRPSQRAGLKRTFRKSLIPCIVAVSYRYVHYTERPRDSPERRGFPETDHGGRA